MEQNNIINFEYSIILVRICFWYIEFNLGIYLWHIFLLINFINNTNQVCKRNNKYKCNTIKTVFI